MSFQHKSFWMLRDGGCMTDGEMGYNNSSRIQPKRSHQWFMDSTGPELFSNKRQAIEAVGSRPVSGISDVTVSSWPNASSFQSVTGQFPDHPFRSESLKTFNLGDGNTPIDSVIMNVGRKDFEHQYDSGSSVSLSMSHTTEDASPCLSFGVRKVKVNQVRDSNSCMAASMGTAYNRSDNTISLGPTYGNVDENTISMGPAFSKADGNFISIGHTFNKGDGSFISMGHNYNKGNENILSMGQSFDKRDGSFISIGQSYEKGDSNLISLSSSYDNGNDNFISMAPSYNKHESVGPSCEKGVGNLISIAQSYDKADFNVTAVGPAQDEGDSSILSVGHNYNKDECHAISFGSFHDETEANRPGSIITSYDLLMNNHNPMQVPDVAGQKELVEATPDSNVDGAPKSNSKTDTKPKTKEPKTAKKVPPNNFPSNVKSLLSTGILDGVHVKYVSWSREKSLKGYIKGTGYSCGCTECKFEKALNAYEFERHANCKTKHPNNHIYFENGKTIYAVVQELKNTPQEMLFDAIQNVTGSQINEKNFRVWKASYQAATRELQRIYGKDEVSLPS
ncbi:hypothetical protein SLE2022_070030 [Rubroshorea leprosula]